MKDCKKAEGMKHECKEGMKDCKKAEGMKHECKEGMKDCKKAEAMKHECKEGAAKQCDKAAMKKMHQECKDHKDGQKCDKPADQQCPRRPRRTNQGPRQGHGLSGVIHQASIIIPDFLDEIGDFCISWAVEGCDEAHGNEFRYITQTKRCNIL